MQIYKVVDAWFIAVNVDQNQCWLCFLGCFSNYFVFLRVYKGKENENELEYTADLEYYNIPKRLRIFARWPIQDLM